MDSFSKLWFHRWELQMVQKLKIELWSTASPRVVPGLGAVASPEDLLQMQILGPHSRL